LFIYSGVHENKCNATLQKCIGYSPEKGRIKMALQQNTISSDGSGKKYLGGLAPHHLGGNNG